MGIEPGGGGGGGGVWEMRLGPDWVGGVSGHTGGRDTILRAMESHGRVLSRGGTR